MYKRLLLEYIGSYIVCMSTLGSFHYLFLKKTYFPVFEEKQKLDPSPSFTTLNDEFPILHNK